MPAALPELPGCPSSHRSCSSNSLPIAQGHLHVGSLFLFPGGKQQTPCLRCLWSFFICCWALDDAAEGLWCKDNCHQNKSVPASERVSMAPCILLWVGPGSFVPGPCDSFELSYYPHFGALVYRTLKTKFCCQIKRQSSCCLIILPPASFLLFLHPVPLVYHPALTLAGFLK